MGKIQSVGGEIARSDTSSMEHKRVSKPIAAVQKRTSFHRTTQFQSTMGDEKFFVKPSAYFFDRHGVHQATHEHLIY